MTKDAEKTYPGFPKRVQQVPVPAPVLGSLLEVIDDLDELKCTLRVIALLNQKRGYPRFVTLREVQADESLARAIPAEGDVSSGDRIERSLANAVKRGTLAFAVAGSGRDRQPMFGLNTESDRAGLAKVAGDGWSADAEYPEPVAAVERPNIYAMYEQNIGLISPMIADALREADGLYPQEWIEEAFGEAAAQNKRSWRYVSTILERWERDGRGLSGSGRHPTKAARF